MSKKVYVSIVGETCVNGESDKTELVTEGVYAERGGKYLLKYRERLFEDGGEPCSTVVKFDKNTITMTRSGISNTQMIFEGGKRHVSHYETPLGSFTVGILTDSINIDMGEDGGNVDIKYMLDIDRGVLVENRLHMKIRNVQDQMQA